MKPTAYSYIRFSSQPQAKGTSVGRQEGMAQSYALENNLVLDTNISLRDLGVSAFKGANASGGALGEFINAVDEGKIKKGSYLLVENMDRLSRLPALAALNQLQRILDRGITVVTLSDGIKYTAENLNENFQTLMLALGGMERSNAESKRKSELLSKAWGFKKSLARSSGTPLGNNAPRWLTYSKENGYRADSERAALVERIFQLTIDGYGRGAIVQILNQEGIPSFKGGTWATSSLQKILDNPAVFGQYQPMSNAGSGRTPSGPPIPNFFPVVISESIFYQAKSATESRYIARATNPGRNFNVWAGIAKCVKCNGNMHISTKEYRYLVCTNTRKGTCDAKATRLDASEKVFVEILAKVDSLSLVQDSHASLASELAELAGRQSDTERRLVDATAAMSAYPSHSLAQLLASLDSEVSALSSQAETVKASLANDQIINKEKFIQDVDLISYKGRNRANDLLKRLKISVVIDTEKPAKYCVFSDGKALLDLHYERTKLIIRSHTPEQFEKLKQQEDGSSIFRMVTAHL